MQGKAKKRGKITNEGEKESKKIPKKPRPARTLINRRPKKHSRGNEKKRHQMGTLNQKKAF